jgi:hypothetical protein
MDAVVPDTSGNSGIRATGALTGGVVAAQVQLVLDPG